MSITDELREWAEGNTLRAGMSLRTARDQALAIADRIDAEHEEKVSYWQGACYEDGYKEGLADNEDAIAEHGWVKLPVDADGEVIRIGDVMENLREDLEPQLHHTFRVYGILYRDYGQKCALTEDGYPTILYRASECRHHHEPTVEDVLLDACKAYHSLMVESMSDVAHDMPAPSEVIAEYAEKLREAVEHDRD